MFKNFPEPELTPVELELAPETVAVLETYAEGYETSIDGVIKLLVERYFASPLVITEETYEEAN
jgi:hypothetical protein